MSWQLKSRDLRKPESVAEGQARIAMLRAAGGCRAGVPAYALVKEAHCSHVLQPEFIAKISLEKSPRSFTLSE